MYALVNENNIVVLTKELLDYLMVSDLEFKIDLSNKICSLASKFAPEKRWYIDTILEVIKRNIYVYTRRWVWVWCARVYFEKYLF